MVWALRVAETAYGSGSAKSAPKPPSAGGCQHRCPAEVKQSAWLPHHMASTPPGSPPLLGMVVSVISQLPCSMLLTFACGSCLSCRGLTLRLLPRLLIRLLRRLLLRLYPRLLLRLLPRLRFPGSNRAFFGFSRFGRGLWDAAATLLTAHMGRWG
jgi:hypothetical protein